MSRIRKAVFPVGGLGTRFLPATKAMPKEMLSVVDKPLIQYAVEEAKAAGIEEFIFVTGRGKSAIEDHFDHSFELEATLSSRGKHDQIKKVTSILPDAGQISYTRQLKPLGLGHAIWCARKLVGDEPFAVLLADDYIMSDTSPCLAQMTEAYEDGNLVAVMDVPQEHTSRYGILDVADTDSNQSTTNLLKGQTISAKGLVEKPSPETAPSTVAIVGRYILHPTIFKHLEAQKPGAGGEIQLTDAMATMIDEYPFHGYFFEGTRFDCGSELGLLSASIQTALRRPNLEAPLREILSHVA